MVNDHMDKYFESDNLFVVFQKNIDRWERKYSKHPCKVILKMIFWCCTELFCRGIRLAASLRLLKPSFQKTDKIRFLIYLRGGIGDISIGATYLKEIYKWADVDCSFDVCSGQNKPALQSIFHGCHFVDQFFHVNKSKYVPADYDVIMDINRYPEIVFYKQELIQKTAPRLKSLLDFYCDFRVSNLKFYKFTPFADTLTVMYSLMNGHTRRTQPDIGHRLGMSEETKPFLMIDEGAFEILERYGLKDKKFVTLQRGTNVIDNILNNVRDWPIEYYNSLILQLKKRYPSLVTIQLGKSYPSVDMDGIDIDLRGKTTFEELKVILKYSSLHIDGECGMVHLKHALNGRSAVFFAQTRIDFCGYPENFNVRADNACPLWCEWVTNDWQKHCLRGCDAPPCLRKLTPDLFFSAIRDYLDEAAQPTFPVLRPTDETVADADKGVFCFIGPFENDALPVRVEEGREIRLFDVSLTRARIEELKQRGIAAEFGDIHNIPMADASCDRIVCSVDPPSEYAMREMARVLKPNGHMEIYGTDKHYYK